MLKITSLRRTPFPFDAGEAAIVSRLKWGIAGVSLGGTVAALAVLPRRTRPVISVIGAAASKRGV